MQIPNKIEDINPITLRNIPNNPWKSVMLYTVISLLWIAFSDQLLLMLTDDVSKISTYQTYKGIFFVLSTAVILYVFIRYDYARTIELTYKVIRSNEELLAYAEELNAMEETLKKNIHELNMTNTMLINQNKYVDEIYNRSNAAVLMWQPDGSVVDCNKQFLSLLEYSDEELKNLNWLQEIVPFEEYELSSKKVENLLHEKSNENYERKLVSKTGTILHFIWNDALVKNPTNDQPMILSFGLDISIQKEQEDMMLQLQTYDTLTGLGNKMNFERTLKKHIRQDDRFTILCIDFDSFRRLNEVHGFKTGDEFLSTYGKALQKNFKDTQCFRWSADEFYIICSADKTEDSLNLTHALMNFSSQKWALGKVEYKPTVTMAVVQYPQNGEDFNQLVKNLDIALNYGKSNNRNQIVYFDEIQKHQLENVAHIAFELGKAIERGEFILHYQPIYQLSPQKMVAAEVLIRWPNQQKVDTGTFIAIAENTGQIKAIDYWVIDSAFKFLADNHQVWGKMQLSINLSAQSFNSYEIVDYLDEKVKEYQIDTPQITFEITEHSIITNLDFTKKMITKLRERGFKVSLDDFGTQYSSLNYLGKLSLNHLKIDKSYTDLITSDSFDHLIVDHIIQLSSKIGLETIAEGIETEEQMKLLIQMGCHMGQGYFLNRPMGPTELLDLIRGFHK